MGSNLDESEKPQHQVFVKSFLLAKYEITQDVWTQVVKTRPWRHYVGSVDNRNMPANYVSWYDAKYFCNQVGLRLPTEEEWEYACRAGSTSKYYWGETPTENYFWNNQNTSSACTVGQKQPNAFGLFDMAGNLYEWCSEMYKPNYQSAKSNVPHYLESKTIRGGSWQHDAWQCRSSARTGVSPEKRHIALGFRPCASIK